MKKTILSLFAFLLLTNFIIAQEYVVKFQPKFSLKWGYADIKGNVIIEPRYKKSFQFSEDGYCMVRDSRRDRYLFINTKGKVLNTEIIQFGLKNTFDYEYYKFIDGLIPICIGGFNWGFLGTNGKITIPVKYQNVSIFNGGHAIAQLKKKFFVLDTMGNEFLIDHPKIDDARRFSEGLAPIEVREKWGFVNTKGEIVIPAQYYGVGYFNYGLAWAKTENGKIGFINKAGEWVIKPRLTVVGNFDEESGLAKVQMGNKWGFINKDSEIKYTNVKEILSLSEGYIMARKKGKIGFLDSNLEWIINPSFLAARNFKNGYAAVKVYGGWGLIDKEGKWILDPIYGNLTDVVKIK